MIRLLVVLSFYALAFVMGWSCSTPSSSEKVAEVAVGSDASVEVDSGAREPLREGGVSRDEGTVEKTPEPQKRVCQPSEPIRPTANFFTDISVKSGIQVGGFVRDFTKKIPINDHSRLGFVDLNGDGYDDIVAHSLFPNPRAGIPFEHIVHLNNGDGTFKPFSDESGLRKVQAAFFVFADVDNDGDQDCFAGIDIPMSGQTNQILINDGTGRFTVKKNSGVDLQGVLAMNAVFADFNNDGKIDLYIGAGGTTVRMRDSLFFGNGDGTFTNVNRNLTNNQQTVSNGTVTCDFDNDGDQDIIVSTYGVSSMLGQNVLWQNDGKGKFTNVAREKGFEALPGGNYFLSTTQFGRTPEPNKKPGQFVGSNGFGVDCKDVNNDGHYDILLTTISHPNTGVYSRKWSDPSQLLINLGSKGQFKFKNEYVSRGLPFNEGDIDGALIDFDNDGLLDISISRDNKYERNYTTLEQKAWFGLYRQKADGKFESLGTQSGINSLTTKNSASLTECTSDAQCTNNEKCLFKRCRQPCSKDDECKSQDDFCASYWDATKNGVTKFCRLKVKMKGAQNHAWSDIDRDGDLDLLVGGRDKGGGRPNFLFRNDIGSKNRWIAVKLIGDGVKINRDAIGARLSLHYKESGRILSREVRSSRGTYNSLDTRTLHFGLAAYGCDYEVKIRWPNGETVTIPTSKLQENKYSKITYPDKVE